MSVLAETEAANHLPLAPIWIGVIALIVFATLLAVTFSFRGVWHRHDPSALTADERAGDGAGRAAGGH